MTYDYYLQDDSTQGIRRYATSELEGHSYQYGERWSSAKKLWTTECADRRSCELTHDVSLTEAEVFKRTT